MTTHKKIRKLGFLISALSVAVASVSHGNDLSDRLQINGFASIAGTWTPDKSVEYMGISNDFGTQTDTKAAVQMRFAIDDNASFTTQILGHADDGFSPVLEWAYLSYKVSPQFMLRAGRLRLPLYLMSETLDVGVSYPWARPYGEVYVTSSSAYEGADATYRLNVGKAAVKLNAYAGSSISGTADLPIRSTESWGVNAEGSMGSFTARLGYTSSKVEIDAAPGSPYAGMSTALTSMGLDDPLDLGRPVYSSIGLSYDNGSVLVMTEMTEAKVDSVFGGSISGYFTAGYRFGKWLPFVSYSGMYTNSKSDKRRAAAVAKISQAAGALSSEQNNINALVADISDDLSAAPSNYAVAAGTATALGLDDVAGLISLAQGADGSSGIMPFIPMLAQAASGLGDAADGMDSLSSSIAESTKSQKSYHLGVRYDVTPKVALKFEATHVFGLDKEGNNVNGETGENADFYTVKLDAMF